MYEPVCANAIEPRVMVLLEVAFTVNVPVAGLAPVAILMVAFPIVAPEIPMTPTSAEVKAILFPALNLMLLE